jgi:DNA repair exonuclease SbcCD ATPase subunit
LENKLEVIVRESGLESTKAQFILMQFQDYFAIAAAWEIKAKGIVVTDDSQKAEMQMARAGRLFLKEKRVAIEKSRKELKEQALREGKAIDGIANVLKALIVPIEEYLDQQEHFVELREAAAEKKRQEEEAARIEAERLAKEEADRLEQERIRAENERLRAEAAERERVLAEERAKVQKAEDDRRAAEAEALLRERKLAEDAAKADAEKQRAEAEVVRLRAAEAERLQKQSTQRQVTCPKCGHEFPIPEAQ